MDCLTKGAQSVARSLEEWLAQRLCAAAEKKLATRPAEPMPAQVAEMAVAACLEMAGWHNSAITAMERSDAK